MNKLLYILFAFSLSVSFSCCSDDDGDDKDSFTWKGDWNDKGNANYVPGGYNPMLGTWISSTGETKLRFNEDLSITIFVFNSNTQKWKNYGTLADYYMVNDIAMKYVDDVSGELTPIYQYIIEGDSYREREAKLQDNGEWEFGEWEEYHRER